MRTARALAACAVFAVLLPGAGQPPPKPGRNSVAVRGSALDVYYVEPRNLPTAAPASAILFASDAAGWQGLSVELAGNIASWGHAVFGLDARRYLATFPSSGAPADAAADMLALARWANAGADRRMILVGFQEGAALAVIALAPSNVKSFRGLAAIALPAVLPVGHPAERTGPWLNKLPPAPLFLIYSSADSRTPATQAKRLFADAREPKRLSILNAAAADFSGNKEGLLRSLRDAIDWIGKNSD